MEHPKFMVLLSLLLCFFHTSLLAQGLSKLATNTGLNFGAGITYSQFTEEPTDPFKETLNKDFNMYFEGNQLKFKNVQPVKGDFRYAPYDSVLALAEKNGKTLRGHCLVWHSIGQNPGWLRAGWEGTPKWTRTQLMDILKTHITTVVNHYKGRIKEWDVVNEGVYLENGHPNGLRTSYWQQIIGDDYIDSAFVWAHRADPSAYLYYNEFGAEGAISSEYAKRDSVYNLMKRLLSRGIPVHGVGLQCHFGNYINAGAISANIKKLGELGLRVSMTEIDMRNTSNMPGNWSGLLNAALENYNCTSFVTCGVDDGHSWFGKDCGCLAWDSLLVAKASIYQAISNTLSAANPTISAKRKAFAAELPYPQAPLPVVSPEIHYCQGETAQPLTAVGKKIKWYTSETGNIYDLFAPTPSTKVVGTKSYFVSQTVNFLESQRVEIKVTVTAPSNWYKDDDGDGKGDPAQSMVSCTQPTGYAAEVWTGMKESTSEENQLTAFPQPFRKNTTIHLKGNETMQSATILTLSGTTVEIKNNPSGNFVVVGDDLNSGVYFAVIRTDKNTFVTKIVKLK